MQHKHKSCNNDIYNEIKEEAHNHPYADQKSACKLLMKNGSECIVNMCGSRVILSIKKSKNRSNALDKQTSVKERYSSESGESSNEILQISIDMKGSLWNDKVVKLPNVVFAFSDQFGKSSKKCVQGSKENYLKADNQSQLKNHLTNQNYSVKYMDELESKINYTSHLPIQNKGLNGGVYRHSKASKLLIKIILSAVAAHSVGLFQTKPVAFAPAFNRRNFDDHTVQFISKDICEDGPQSSFSLEANGLMVLVSLSGQIGSVIEALDYLIDLSAQCAPSDDQNYGHSLIISRKQPAIVRLVVPEYLPSIYPSKQDKYDINACSAEGAVYFLRSLNHHNHSIEGRVCIISGTQYFVRLTVREIASIIMMDKDVSNFNLDKSCSLPTNKNLCNDSYLSNELTPTSDSIFNDQVGKEEEVMWSTCVPENTPANTPNCSREYLNKASALVSLNLVNSVSKSLIELANSANQETVISSPKSYTSNYVISHFENELSNIMLIYQRSPYIFQCNSVLLLQVPYNFSDDMLDTFLFTIRNIEKASNAKIELVKSSTIVNTNGQTDIYWRISGTAENALSAFCACIRRLSATCVERLGAFSDSKKPTSPSCKDKIKLDTDDFLHNSQFSCENNLSTNNRNVNNSYSKSLNSKHVSHEPVKEVLQPVGSVKIENPTIIQAQHEKVNKNMDENSNPNDNQYTDKLSNKSMVNSMSYDLDSIKYIDYFALSNDNTEIDNIFNSNYFNEFIYGNYCDINSMNESQQYDLI